MQDDTIEKKGVVTSFIKEGKKRIPSKISKGNVN